MSTMKIERVEDVQEGDRVTVRTKAGWGMVANEELTATAVTLGIEIYVLGYPLDSGFFEFVSATREVSDQPDLPEYYVDKRGVVWEQIQPETWVVIGGSGPMDALRAAQYAPFTRLVPETELVEQRKEIAGYLLASTGLHSLESLADRIERGKF